MFGRSADEPGAIWPDVPDGGLIKALALAVVRPGGNALLIDTDNRSGGWVRLEEAVVSGRAFAVEVADSIFAGDGDQPERVADVLAFVNDLRHEGLRPVLTASGRNGHRHVFCRVPQERLRAGLEERARRTGLRPVRTIRPPLAPHRLGLKVALLEPTNPWEAIAALSRPLKECQALSPRMADLLRHGDCAGRYRDRGRRSALIQAIALAAVNAGWAEADLLDALLDPGNAAGEKLRRRRSISSAREYVRHCWLKAQRRAERVPPFDGRDAALAAIERIRVAGSHEAWSARASDWEVLQAHLSVAQRVGKITYHADVRTLADTAAVTAPTVTRANRRLRASGWLRLVTPAVGAKANVWTLALPGRLAHTCNTLTSPSGGDEAECFSSALQQLGGDLWRRIGGLGKVAFRIWSLLTVELPRQVADLVRLLRLRPRTVQLHLSRLAAFNLAVCDGGGWRRGPADPGTVAQSLGVHGLGTRQRWRHEAEREAFRSWPSPWITADGSSNVYIAERAYP